MNNTDVAPSSTKEAVPDAVRRLIGAVILLLTGVLTTFYTYVVRIILTNKMFKQVPFYMWFVSLGLSDVCFLCIRLYAGLVIVSQNVLLSEQLVLLPGHLSALFYFISLFHFPVMAACRALSLIAPSAGRRCVGHQTAVFCQTTGIWLLGALVTVAVQLPRGNWLWWNPVSMTWEADCGECYTAQLDAVWQWTPLVCAAVMVLMYAVCILKLKWNARQMEQFVNDTHRRGERNLIKVGAAQGVGQLVTVIFWRIHSQYLAGKGWWSNLLLTLAEIIIAGQNGIVLYCTCREISVKSRFRTSSLYRFLCCVCGRDAAAISDVSAEPITAGYPLKTMVTVN